MSDLTTRDIADIKQHEFYKLSLEDELALVQFETKHLGVKQSGSLENNDLFCHHLIDVSASFVLGGEKHTVHWTTRYPNHKNEMGNVLQWDDKQNNKKFTTIAFLDEEYLDEHGHIVDWENMMYDLNLEKKLNYNYDALDSLHIIFENAYNHATQLLKHMIQEIGDPLQDAVAQLKNDIETQEFTIEQNKQSDGACFVALSNVIRYKDIELPLTFTNTNMFRMTASDNNGGRATIFEEPIISEHLDVERNDELSQIGFNTLHLICDESNPFANVLYQRLNYGNLAEKLKQCAVVSVVSDNNKTEQKSTLYDLNDVELRAIFSKYQDLHKQANQMYQNMLENELAVENTHNNSFKMN